MEVGSINKLLYEARIKKGVKRKEASLFLGVNPFYLKLIEEGYLDVPVSRYNYFINYYDLSKDFFIRNSNYVEPLKEDKINFEELRKTGKKLVSKKVRIFSIISIFTSACCVAFGIYANNRTYLNPRIAWTANYTEFNNRMKKKGEKGISILDKDYIYTVNREISDNSQDLKVQTSITIYDKEISADQTTLTLKINKNIDKPEQENATFYFIASNKKKVLSYVYSDYGENIYVNFANIIISSDNQLTFRPFDCKKNGETIRVKPGSKLFDKVSDKVTMCLMQCSIFTDYIFQTEDLVYSTAFSLFDDVKKISRDKVLFARLGITFTPIFSFVGVYFIIVLCLSFYSQYQLKHSSDYYQKKSKEELAILNYSSLPDDSRYSRDINYPFLLPEFIVRIVGLSILLVSSIALFLTVYLLFQNGIKGFMSVSYLRNISTNFLSSAILLLFFIKLDVYKKKNANELLTNIISLFLYGLVFYIVEVLLFRSIVKEGSVFSDLLNALIQIIPGNIIWNIMLYSLIFYFLFTMPRAFEGNKKKMFMWRMFSLIPTSILIFALFYRLYFEGMFNESYYISLMFHTSGVNTTSFAILYLYSLYFFDLILKLNYGYKNTYKFMHSKRYAVYKNLIASVILILLFIADLIARFYYPNNIFKLGQNWAIICLVPIIMLYRPHIGARNKKWDNVYALLYGGFLTGGYISVAIYIVSMIDIAEILYILF